MATRSIIAKTQPSGKIKASYCHFDGYPEHNGKILASYYTDKKKINALLAEGEISVLGHNIGKKIDFNDYQLCHALNQCRFYHRDRGEKLRKHTVKDASELEEYAKVDSVLSAAKSKQIQLLQARDKSNEELIKTLQPKWYENQYLWLGIGFVLGKL